MICHTEPASMTPNRTAIVETTITGPPMSPVSAKVVLELSRGSPSVRMNVAEMQIDSSVWRSDKPMCGLGDKLSCDKLPC
jgi:hypothetical protein